MNRRAFTLVELMVVIVILGLLLALLVPAGQQAWSVVRITICRNNLYHIYQTFGTAAADSRLSNSGQTPFFPKPDAWIGTAISYSETSNILLCPETEDKVQETTLSNPLSHLAYVHRVRSFQVAFDDPGHQGFGHMNLGTWTGSDERGDYIDIGTNDNVPIAENYWNDGGAESHDGIIRIYLDAGGRTIAKLMRYSCGEYNCVLYDGKPLFTAASDPAGVTDPSSQMYGWMGPSSSKVGMEVELGVVATSSCSYGMAKGAELFGTGHHKILVMDYGKPIVDPTISASHDLLLKAGRHMGQINILFTDGSINSFGPTEIDPLIPRNAVFWSP
jgi:prepilin-type N-terminal cleavage/methylation domain-containing protein/prepilin-type processing-associated H-X9-DG protein